MDEAQGLHNYTCSCAAGWTGVMCGVPTTLTLDGAAWASAPHTADKKSLDVTLEFR